MIILLGFPALGEIPGKDDEIGGGVEQVERRHGLCERGGGIDDAHKKCSRRRDMRVGDLGNQHHDLGAMGWIRGGYRKVQRCLALPADWPSYRADRENKAVQRGRA
jgi:hypothetical protein